MEPMLEIKKHLKKLTFLGEISELAEREGIKLFAVGGFVRDFLLKRETNEIDLLVLGDGISFCEKTAQLLETKNISIYKNFGTAHIKYKNFDIEFVGARKESYSQDSRNPEIAAGTFEDDINRRDFTINTLAVSLNRENFGELIDSFNGLQDLENKLIRTPLDPQKTFDDDPLRIMRAFRFAAQLNFNLSPELKMAASELAPRLKIISQERITDEFLKILSAPAPSIGMKLLFECGVLPIIFPEISDLAGVDQREDYHHKDVFLHTLKVVDNIAAKSDDVWLRFAGLVHDIAKPKTKRFAEGTGWTFHGHEEIGARMMKSIFRRMKLPLIKLEYIEKLIRLHLRPIALVDEGVTDSAVRRLIVSAGDDLEDLFKLCRSDITSKNPAKKSQYLKNYDNVLIKVYEVEEKDKLRQFQSPVRGDIIMKVCNLKPSKKVGEIKTAIEEAILEGEIKNTYEDAYDYLLKIKDQLLEQGTSS